MRKVPELADHFVSKAKNLLADRNHGVLLTAITLVTEMCQIDPNCLEEFRNVRNFDILLLDILNISRRLFLSSFDI